MLGADGFSWMSDTLRAEAAVSLETWAKLTQESAGMLPGMNQ